MRQQRESDPDLSPTPSYPLMGGSSRRVSVGVPAAPAAEAADAAQVVTVGGLRARTTSYNSLAGTPPDGSPPAGTGSNYRITCYQSAKAAEGRTSSPEGAPSGRRRKVVLGALLGVLSLGLLLHYSLIGYCLGQQDEGAFLARQGTAVCGLHRSLPETFRYRAGFRKPASRGDLSRVVNGAGSMFGHVYQRMDCPRVAPTPRTGQDTSVATRQYTPRMLFPMAKAGQERSSVPKDWDGQLTLLVGVLSSCKATFERETARSTWQRLAVPEGSTWRAVFILSNRCKEELQEESDKYGDLEFFDTAETYYALTPKVFKFFEYARGVGAKYTMKTDDDTFVFVDRLLSELQTMPESCLYWGGAERLPNIESYDYIGLNVPLNKWYIQKSDFRVIAGTPYMAGGGYILSQDLTDQVVERSTSIPWVDRMPEDATLGRVLGWTTYSNCHCHDSRHLKHITLFQGVQLFSEGMLPCERADVSRRMLTMHGFKNMTQMWEVFRYTTEDWDLGCMINSRNYAHTSNHELWGKSIGAETMWINPIAKTTKLNMALKKSLTVNPWNLRRWYTPYTEIWDPQPPGFDPYTKKFLRSPPHYWAISGAEARQIVPLGDALDEMSGGVHNRHRKDSALPWCTRMMWASQILDIVQELNSRNALVCDMTMRSYFLNTTNLRIQLNKGDIPQAFTPSKWFHSDSVCFAASQCQACFLQESRDWLTENTHCNTDVNRCTGYDGLAQAKVAIRSVINRILLVPGWASHGWGHAESSTNLEQQVTGILNAVLNKAAVAPSGEGAAEYAESAIKAAVDAFKTVATAYQASSCASTRANGLKRALSHVVPKPDPPKVTKLRASKMTQWMMNVRE
eukprot:jgi/Tetstr1/422383/TSEL_013222.t2